MSAGTPVNLTLLTNAAATPVFSGNHRTRVASDGNQFLYFAGQGLSNQLVVERRSANLTQTGVRDSLFTSVGPVRLVDLKRSPSGQGVLVLAVYSQAGASFEGISLPYATGSGGNVLLVRLEAEVSPVMLAFDRPGDQQPVGFAIAGSELVIAINEGPNAVLWRIPAP